MDEEKAKLIFEKFNEILEIVDSEDDNLDYFSMSKCGDMMFFNNDPECENPYAFTMYKGRIERIR